MLVDVQIVRGNNLVISKARQIVGQTKDRIIVIDADDPYDGSSLKRFCAFAAKHDVDCIIGRRDQIELTSEDEISSYTRLFVEIFSNTLLLGRLGALPKVIAETKAPDIQSGLYAITGKKFGSLDFSYVNIYGGELAIYHQLSTTDASIIESSVITTRCNPSSYQVGQILREILSLPFFSALSDIEVKLALSRGPFLYSEFLSADAKKLYKRELRTLLSSMHLRV